MIKKKVNIFVFLLLGIFFVLIPFATSFDESEILCGGDEELQVLCIGSDELSSGLFKTESTGSYTKTSTEENKFEFKFNELTTFMKIILLIAICFLLLIFLIIIMRLISVDKNRKQKFK